MFPTQKIGNAIITYSVPQVRNFNIFLGAFFPLTPMCNHSPSQMFLLNKPTSLHPPATVLVQSISHFNYEKSFLIKLQTFLLSIILHIIASMMHLKHTNLIISLYTAYNTLMSRILMIWHCLSFKAFFIPLSP